MNFSKFFHPAIFDLYFLRVGLEFGQAVGPSSSVRPIQ